MMLSIIIPVYNGEKTISSLFNKIKQFCEQKNYQYEVIFVWDCGPDQSWNVIKKLKNEYPSEVKAISLSRNFGQHNAIICGIKNAKGDFIITMDEDLQHNPIYIHDLLVKQNETDCDVVYGKYEEKNHTLFRNITSNLLNKLLKISIPDLHPDYSAFRLIKKSVAKEILNMNNSYSFIDGYLSWITKNVSSINIKHEKRLEGKSSYTLTKLINHSINIFVTFSDSPVRFVTYSSFVIFSLTTIYSIYLVIRKIWFNDLLSGFTSIMVILGFGIGLILLSVGILGEYIYRINLKTTKRPNFIEKEVL